MDNELRSVKGIGEKTEALLNRLGIFTTEDLLNFYPRTYEIFPDVSDINSLTAGDMCAIYARLSNQAKTKQFKSLKITTAVFSDSTGSIEVTWFNMPFLQKMLKPGFLTLLYGRVTRKAGHLVMEQPAIYKADDYRKLINVMQPIYPLTEGLSNKTVIKAVKSVMDKKAAVKDFIPAKIRVEKQLPELNFAINNIHFPQNAEAFRKARERLVFNEFFSFIIMLSSRKEASERLVNPYKLSDSTMAADLQKKLPYELTDAQTKVLNEIMTDLNGDYLMNRLVQGDVGSGKTILAVLALVHVAASGYQGALMAPTEVLARQHYESVTALFEKMSVKLHAVLLTGSMSAKEKNEACRQIREHEADIIIGTHALIQEKVIYDKLALVITDEQHRFGVRQRETLMKKNGSSETGDIYAHVLVMSATPIPRTLAIILYGDLDISIIDELPANRLPIKNCVVDTSYRPNAYRFIENEVRNGHQAYIICPMIEANEEMEAESVISYITQLKEALSDDIQIECLHGKMKAKDKNFIMQQFAENKIQVLVSTTVIEVGINVPNATVMMVENAERFGLAQLHQLRGRVGRGNARSYCIFVNSSDKPEAKERLDILVKSNNGFVVAEEDLKLRGPGDLLGIRQSGDMLFKIGDIYGDADILKSAGDCAKTLLAENPLLEGEEYTELSRYVKDLWDKYSGTINL